MDHNLKLSVLNLVPVREGQTYKDAIEAMIELAKYAESLGYERYWIAEHHNVKTYISSATVLLIQRTLENTCKIRVGAGGIMLPNHSPLVVAEQFGTLEAIYPSRVDLGLGRAPGTDRMTADALRRSRHEGVEEFPREVKDLLRYFDDEEAQGLVRAYPGVGAHVPITILGSSHHSAVLAGRLGLPYSFAAHFSSFGLDEALRIYRSEFKPSKYLDKPYVIVGVNALAAETMNEAIYQRTTMQQMYLSVLQRV